MLHICLMELLGSLIHSWSEVLNLFPHLADVLHNPLEDVVRGHVLRDGDVARPFLVLARGLEEVEHLAEHAGPLLPAAAAVPRLEPPPLAGLCQVHHDEEHVLAAEDFSAQVTIRPVDQEQYYYWEWLRQALKC